MARTGRKCTVCEHEQVIAINQSILRGESIRNVAKQFGLGESSVFRHKRDHISSVLAKAQEAVEIARADSLLDQVKSLQTKALALLEQAEAAGDLRTALQAIKEVRGNLELQAKMIWLATQEGENAGQTRGDTGRDPVVQRVLDDPDLREAARNLFRKAVGTPVVTIGSHEHLRP